MEESEEDSMDNSISVTKHKIIFVGDAGVGKTSIINRIVDNPFKDTYEMSIGVDFMSKNLNYKGQNIKLLLWDSAGQEKYKGLIPSYVRNSSIVFVVYDISSKTSFNNVSSWITFIKSIENTRLVLCGNKIDLTTREVEKSEGEQFAQKEGISFFEVCAETGENIKFMFYSVVADLLTFAEGTTNKENLIKELQQENGVENITNNVQNPKSPEEEKTINVDGKPKPVQPKKKKGCGC